MRTPSDRGPGKERVYAYFRGKEALYAHIAERELTVVAEPTRTDPADLHGYAGRLFGCFTARPDHHRLITWGRLELSGSAGTADDPTRARITRRLGQLRQAQQTGQLDPGWDPAEILARGDRRRRGRSRRSPPCRSRRPSAQAPFLHPAPCDILLS